ncbi:MAG TPA: 5-formyltetrahydrofolate cyclo-ligase [Gammaproteobacteria bacterium]|nr:5-formyltetrahydrofolate cyclo-ligase [Gammaproteobacteria bacterium]
MTRDALRQQLRAARRALTPEVRLQHAISAAMKLCESAAYREARRIAVYVAMDGELDPTPLVMRAHTDGREVYLPVLPPMEGPMSFRPYKPDTTLVANRFGIPEPKFPEGGRIAKEMDLVITPLVGFDLAGNRLGMGAGFYDRTFGFLRHMEKPHPLLIGYAYELQKVPALSAESWDVPLAAVATEQHFYPRPPP